jgi:hypothetical protein
MRVESARFEVTISRDSIKLPSLCLCNFLLFIQTMYYELLEILKTALEILIIKINHSHQPQISFIGKVNYFDSKLFAE